MSTALPFITPRPVAGFANYPGDVVEAISLDAINGRPFGPNYMGEKMWPVSADYDAATNKTRVGFSLVAPGAVA